MEKPVCVIVGVGAGLGQALARRFGSEGMRVALLARSTDKLEQRRAQLADAGVDCAAFPADAADPASLSAAIGRVQDTLGAPEVLIYNAAILRQGLPSAVTTEHLVEEFRINVAGALAAAQAVLPGMQARGRGTILLTGGGLALAPQASLVSLSVGKAGIRSLAQSLAQELGPQGIHVATVTICGFIKPDTPFAPERIAERYWELHQQPPTAWETEVLHR